MDSFCNQNKSSFKKAFRALLLKNNYYRKYFCCISEKHADISEINSGINFSNCVTAKLKTDTSEMQ
jgi:hypothetical protein